MPSGRLFAFTSLAVALVTAIVLCMLFSSQHRVRLIVGSFETVDSQATLPHDASLTFMVPQESTNAPSFDSIIRELTAYEIAHPLRGGDAMPALDQPDTCERLLAAGNAIHCYNADIAVCAILGREGILARMWDMTGPTELGGNGHNLLEVFDRSSNSWKALDPYYSCYFTLAPDSLTPIDVPTLRLALLETPERVRMIRYAHSANERPDETILQELRSLAPCVMLHGNNNFRERYDHRYGWLMPFSSQFDKLPLRAARGVRTLMLGSDDKRYVIEDSHSPHYPFRTLPWIFSLLLLLFGIFLVLGILSIRKISRSNYVTPSR